VLAALLNASLSIGDASYITLPTSDI